MTHLKSLFSAFLIASSLFCVAADSPYQQQFSAAAASGDDAKVESIAHTWATAEPDNPQVYVDTANYYFCKARRESFQLSTKPPEGDDLVITDTKSGAVAGSLGTIIQYDPAIAAHAVDALQIASRKFPFRLDIWFGLAHIQQELDNFEAQFVVLSEAFKYAAGHAELLKWTNGDPLPAPPAKYIPETAQDYLSHYSERQTPQDDERFLRLAKLMLTYYPTHPYPLNDVAWYYTTKEQWQNALPYLEKAHASDPEDSLVTLNLGTLYVKLKNRKKARRMFEAVIASAADPEIRDAARQKLIELK